MGPSWLSGKPKSCSERELSLCTLEISVSLERVRTQSSATPSCHCAPSHRRRQESTRCRASSCGSSPTPLAPRATARSAASASCSLTTQAASLLSIRRPSSSHSTAQLRHPTADRAVETLLPRKTVADMIKLLARSFKDCVGQLVSWCIQ